MEKGSLEEIIRRTRAWCARQERCTPEVIEKLRKNGAEKTSAHIICEGLKKAGFVNDLRYARAFCDGHSRLKSWGPVKLRNALRAKGLQEEIIDKALIDIPEDDLEEAFRKAVAQAIRLGHKSETPRDRVRFMRFLVGKGHEYLRVMRYLSED